MEYIMKTTSSGASLRAWVASFVWGAASELRCTAPGVGERLGVAIEQAGIIDPEGRSALCIDFGVAVHGRALQHVVGVMAQRRDLIASITPSKI